MPATDAELLIVFARHRDEAAFHKLARQHFGLIFHAALRCTHGNRTLAEDVSQEVLCILAKKAAYLALRPERLPAWLHRTTLLECKTAMRKEISQQRRKQLVHPDDLPSSAPAESPQALWEQALPHLDQALDQLPEPDRRILLLHFFESLSFPRIAQALGKTPAAVQKQSSRAVARLGAILRRKGVVLPTLAIIAGLTTESAKAAPLSLLPSFTAKAVSTSAGLSTLSSISLMIATHQKFLAPCALLLLALPLGLQQAAIAKAEQRLAKLTFSLPPPSTPRTVAANASGRTGGVQVSTSLDPAQIAEEAWLATRADSLMPALRLKLQALSTAELSKLLLSAGNSEIPSEKRHDLAQLVAAMVGKDDPGAAARGMIDSGWVSSSEPTVYFMRWVEQDPAAAQAWLVEAQKRPEFAPDFNVAKKRFPADPDSDSLPLSGAGSLAGLQGGLLRYLLATDGEAAGRYLATFPADTIQPDLLREVFSGWRKDSRLTPGEAANYLTVIRDDLRGDLKPVALRALVKAAPMVWLKSAKTNWDILFQAAKDDSERRQIATIVTESLIKRALDSPPSSEPVENSSEWLARVMPDQAAEIQAEAEAKVFGKLEEHEDALLKTLASSPNGDDHLANALTARPFRYHLDEALKMAEQIQNPVLREKALKKLNAQKEK